MTSFRSITRYKGQEALQEVIALAKRGKLSKRTLTAANETYLKCIG